MDADDLVIASHSEPSAIWTEGDSAEGGIAVGDEFAIAGVCEGGDED